MAVLDIVMDPAPVLRRGTEQVTEFDDNLQRLVDDMLETMYEVNGVGLAAPQVGIALRLAVMDVTMERNESFVLVNPEIIERRGKQIMAAGCLSVPGAYDKVERSEWVKVKAQDRHGEWFEIEGEGLKAECLQHEIDHLDGMLFLDHLSPLKQRRLREKMKKTLKSRKRKQN